MYFPDKGKKAKKAVKAEVSVDDAAIEAVLEALHSVKHCANQRNKCNDVAYNFCMTMYYQLKTMSKKKQKITRNRINSIMMELESDSEWNLSFVLSCDIIQRSISSLLKLKCVL